MERQTYGDFEAIVVCDGTEDDTVTSLTNRAVRVIERPREGIAAARNHGWQAAKGELVVFADDDVEPEPGWLQAFVDAAAVNPRAILQGRVLPNPREAAGLAKPLARSLEITGLSSHFETANILYPRTVLEQLGGFDPALTAAGEDADLGQRAMALGVQAVFVKDALAYHAVHERDLRHTLRDAARATDGVRVYRDHPNLREDLRDGVWYDPSHPLLAQAVVGGLLARKRPSALAFAAPYVAYLAKECHRTGVPMRTMGLFALRDAVQLGATVRGAVRHRTFVL